MTLFSKAKPFGEVAKEFFLDLEKPRGGVGVILYSPKYILQFTDL